MQNNHIPYGPYERFLKRPLDIFCSLLAIMVFWWLYLVIAILVRVNLGSPVLFTQERPGRIDKLSGQERIFKLYKFRTMTDERNEDGALLPDEKRLTRFGKWLRSTSLDELPEVWNILKGDMSVVGPRPLLVKDMVFMTLKQRKRHTVRPGLTGLAQVNGRNNIFWDEKFRWDFTYVSQITLAIDLKIILKTFCKVIRREDTTFEGWVTAEDLGDYLLRINRIDCREYRIKLTEADDIIRRKEVG